MALIRLTETFTPDLDQRKFSSKRAITEADISKLSGDRLSESARRYLEETPAAVLEGKTVWKVPISKYDWKNANGRVYEKKLWERVISEQRDCYQGNIGLADHPGDEADGSFKESAVVWLNMGLDENNKLVWGECIFVGPHGKLAEEIMEAGGRVGFSSSGFGELSEANRSIVRWDTYQLERPADLVLNPSQGVYGRQGMQIKKESSGMHEATETKENEPMSINESTGTPRGEVVKLSKQEIRSFREQAESYFGSAKTILNPKDRLEELTEIHSYWEDSRLADVAVELKERVEAEIKTAQAEIQLAITEHVKLKENFELTSVDLLKEGVQKIVVDTQHFKRTADEWKSLAEGLQEKVQKLTAVLNTRPTADVYKQALDQIKKVKEIASQRETELLAEIGKQTTQLKKRALLEKQMVTELNKIAEAQEVVQAENAALREQAKDLKGKLNKIALEEKQYQASLQEAQAREDDIVIHPHGNRPSGNAQVREYYADLAQRYGRDILPYKESILACKTLKEAAQVHIKALANMGYLNVRISEALPVEDRRALIETHIGRNLTPKTTNPIRRMPATWE